MFEGFIIYLHPLGRSTSEYYAVQLPWTVARWMPNTDPEQINVFQGFILIILHSARIELTFVISKQGTHIAVCITQGTIEIRRARKRTSLSFFFLNFYLFNENFKLEYFKHG